MKIVVINGTPIKGVTYTMKEKFLDNLRNGNEITEFYPEAFPGFCTGCKNCFLKSEENCPHFTKKAPIWDAVLRGDLLVFAYPVYALRAPASIKSLLDHLCVHWLVHRPEPAIFEKTAVIITNSVGAPNGAAQKDVKTSLNWMGLSRVYTCGAPMMGDIFVDDMTKKHHVLIMPTISGMGGFNRQPRKMTKNKTIFPSDDSLLKMLYLPTMEITKK